MVLASERERKATARSKTMSNCSSDQQSHKRWMAAPEPEVGGGLHFPGDWQFAHFLALAEMDYPGEAS
jgi:hypothetical protein